MCCIDLSVTDLRKLDVLGSENPAQHISQSKKVCDAEEHFSDIVTNWRHV